MQRAEGGRRRERREGEGGAESGGRAAGRATVGREGEGMGGIERIRGGWGGERARGRARRRTEFHD